MERKQLVKSGTSLLAISTLIFLFSFKDNKSSKEEIISKNSSEQRTRLTTQAEKHESVLKTLKTSKDNLRKSCLELVDTYHLDKRNHDKMFKNWTNYYLQKDGIDYVLRVVKDVNLQNIEVDKIKFFRLDSEGFPTIDPHYNDTIAHSQDVIEKILVDYKIVETSETLTHQEKNLTFIKTNGKLTQIVDQLNNTECNFKI